MSDPVVGALLGAAVGVLGSPFVAVCVERLPERASLTLPWRIRFPLVSSLLTIATCVALGLRFGPSAQLAVFLYLGVVGSALGVIDVLCRRLPNALTYPSYPIVVGLLAVGLLGEDDLGDALGALIGGGVFFGVFLLLWLIRPADLGLGDVKLSGILGLVLGWLGIGSWFVGLMAGFLIGGVVSLLLLVIGKAGRKSRVPYGPFMLSGALVGILWGATWASSYIGTPIG